MWLNWSSKLQDERKKHPCCTTFCVSRCIIWRFYYLSKKLPLFQKLRYFRGSRFSQCVVPPTTLHWSLPNKFLCKQFLWVVTNSVQYHVGVQYKKQPIFDKINLDSLINLKGSIEKPCQVFFGQQLEKNRFVWFGLHTFGDLWWTTEVKFPIGRNMGVFYAEFVCLMRSWWISKFWKFMF